MVNKSLNMLNMKPQLVLYTDRVSEDNNWLSPPDVKISNNNNYNDKEKKPNIIMLRF